MRKVLAGAAVLGMTAGSSMAVTSSFWTITTQEGFAAGELTNVSVNSGGKVNLAPPLEQLADTEELYVWSMVNDTAGNLFVGTGNNGRLFKLSPDGGLSLLADLEEPDVLCLLMRQDGERLYAGTSGGGTIYEIDLSGSVTSFHDTGQRYVWDLAFDDDGSLLVATGDEGRIYRIDGQGKATRFFDSPETHIMHLKPGRDGMVYAGGEGKGLVYRLSPGGDPFVLHELAEPEVCCLLLGADGALYAAGISVPGTGPRGSPVPVGPVPEPTVPANAAHAMQVMDELQNGTPPAAPPGVMQMAPPGVPRGPGGGGSTIYRIDPDGVVTRIWHSSNDVVHALHLDAAGTLIASTGQRGRLYRINPADRTWAVMAEVSASQLTTIVDLGDGEMVLGAANMGTLFHVGPGHAQDGSLESTVYDALTWAKWGRLSWRATTPGGTSIEFQTRSGNSSDPDSSWSPWAELDNRGNDRNNDGGQAASPNARFVQWRAELSSSKPTHTPLLQRVSLAYMQRNLKPEVHHVAVIPRSSSRNNSRPPEAANVGGGQPDSSPSTGRPSPGPPPGPTDNPVRGPWVVKWHASDGNADRLRYDLYFRSLDDDSWTLLEEDLSSESHRWDTASFPDGFYELKVVVSDERSNPPEVALWAHKISEPVLVDNTPPEIRGLKMKYGDEGTLHVSGVAQDGTVPLTEGYYRVDAGDWVPMSAADGIFDSAEESFAFEVSLGEESGHALVVRITDMAGNVALERVRR